MKFTINERKIQCDVEWLIGDNADYEATFDFDEEWDGLTKTARFQMKKKYVDVLIEDGVCIIPVEILKQGILKVGVYTDTITTTFCELKVRPSIKEETGVVAKPTEDVYEQIIDMINDLNTHGTSSVTDKLAGKKILCIGDSLMAGNGWEGGYANCIKENHPTVEITNIAVSGAKIIGGEIFGQVTDYYVAGNTSPDIIIFDGGGNDFMNRSTLGTGMLDSSFTNGTSDTTCDALETMINGVKTVYPFTKLLYISTPPMQQWDDGNVVAGVPTPSVQREYLDAIEKVLAKWSIPIADIYRNGNVTSMNASQLGEFFMSGDTVHLNEAGYRQVAPVINDALDKLF